MAHLLRHPAVVPARDVSDVAAVEDRPMFSAVVGQVLILVAAAVLLLSGALTLARAGLDGAMSTPVVQVFGYTHTAWLGFIELGVGVLLLLSGIAPTTRDLAAALGVLLVIAGILILTSTSSLPSELAVQHSYGGFVIIVGVLATIGGLIPGGWVRRFSQRTTALPPEV